jgi:hypothetical protein
MERRNCKGVNPTSQSPTLKLCFDVHGIIPKLKTSPRRKLKTFIKMLMMMALLSGKEVLLVIYNKNPSKKTAKSSQIIIRGAVINPGKIKLSNHGMRYQTMGREMILATITQTRIRAGFFIFFI